MSKHQHSWVKISDKHVKCEICGKITYLSKLTPQQRARVKDPDAEPPKYEPIPQDYLMWVGRSYYTIESFIQEARKMGVCKRVPMLPRGVVPGKSRVFLVHDTSEAEKKQKKRGVPRVFAYFVVKGIAYIVKKGVDLPKEFEKRGVKAYEYKPGAFGFNDERGCGSLQIGGVYLLSEEDLEKCRDLAESGLLKGNIQVLNPPIEVPGLNRFRGYRCIDGDELLKTGDINRALEKGNETYWANRRAMKRYKRRLRLYQKKHPNNIENFK